LSKRVSYFSFLPPFNLLLVLVLFVVSFLEALSTLKYLFCIAIKFKESFFLKIGLLITFQMVIISLSNGTLLED